MTYLVDTDWIANFLKGRQDAYTLFQKLTFPEMAISLITYGEIYDGIYRLCAICDDADSPVEARF